MAQRGGATVDDLLANPRTRLDAISTAANTSFTSTRSRSSVFHLMGESTPPNLPNGLRAAPRTNARSTSAPPMIGLVTSLTSIERIGTRPPV